VIRNLDGLSDEQVGHADATRELLDGTTGE